MKIRRHSSSHFAQLLLGSGVIALATWSPAFAAGAVAADQTAAAQSVPEQPVAAGQGAPDAGNGIADIVVTARRHEESLQKVPVAVTVVGQEQISRVGNLQATDLQTLAPGLNSTGSVGNGNRNDAAFTIRGQGSTYGTLFPAVVTYFAEVPTAQFGTGQFFDLQNMQILRGPQGVQFGRVTDGGNIMVSPHVATNRLEGEVTLKGGDYNYIGGSGFLNIPVIDDKLLLRAAFDIASRRGFTHNLYNDTWEDSLGYQSGRISLTFKPSSDFTNTVIAQYQHTNDTGTSVLPSMINADHLTGSISATYPLVVYGATPIYGINSAGSVVPYQAGMTPLSVAAYVANYQNDVAKQMALGPRQVYNADPVFDRRNNLYVVNTTDIHISDNLQLKNVFGYTSVKEVNSSQFIGGNGGLLSNCHSACDFASGIPFNHQKQISEELRLSGQSFGRHLTWSLGFYADEQSPDGLSQNSGVELGILQYAQQNYTTTKSRAGYGYAEYDLSDLVEGLKLNGGFRHTHDTVTASTLYAFKLLPAPGLSALLQSELGPQLGAATAAAVLPQGVCGDYAGGIFTKSCRILSGSFNADTWSFGASYQADRNVLIYAKYSKGYRPGGVNGTAPTSIAPTYNPEYDRSAEVGLKSRLDLGTMHAQANIAGFYDKYTGIQELADVSDSTGASDSVIQNTSSAKIWGIEFEGILVPVGGLTLNLNYAYTHAKFDQNVPIATNNLPAGCDTNDPAPSSYCPYNRFVATPESQLSLGVHYDFALAGDTGNVTFGGQMYYQSSEAQITNSFPNLPDSISPGYATFNLDASWKNVAGKPVDITFFMTNLTNKLYTISRSDLLSASGVGASSRTYGAPRMFGFSVSYRFGAAAG